MRKFFFSDDELQKRTIVRKPHQRDFPKKAVVTVSPRLLKEVLLPLHHDYSHNNEFR